MIRKRYNLDGFLTRRVLIEKISKNNLLYIYTFPNTCKNIINPFVTVWKQLEGGEATAKRLGLEPIEYSEVWLGIKPNSILCRVQSSLLKLAISGKIKHLYIKNTKLLCPRNSVIRTLLLQIYSLNSVNIYDENGLVKLNYVDCRNLKGYEDLNYIIEMIDEIVQNPFERTRN